MPFFDANARMKVQHSMQSSGFRSHARKEGLCAIQHAVAPRPEPKEATIDAWDVQNMALEEGGSRIARLFLYGAPIFVPNRT